MAIGAGYITNFNTLVAAFANGDVCLLECTSAETGKPVIALCACEFDGVHYNFVPLAKLFDGNPYEELKPPAGAVNTYIPDQPESSDR